MAQERVERGRGRSRSQTTSTPVVGGTPGATARGKKIKKDLDKLIDEIDEILEENAEEFVKGYIQRGGE